MKNASDYAVVYDISEHYERARIARVLKEFGFRVQKSVFECRLTKTGKNKLIEKLKALKITSGSIKIYRLEYSWKACTIGVSEKKSFDEDNIYFI